MTTISRRDALRWSLVGTSSLLVTSLATGLPVSFLRTGVARAQSATKPTFLVLSFNSGGDPINANCPGSYPNPNDANDISRAIEHATVAELGTKVYGEVGGVPYGAADFETGFPCRLGDVEAWAARPWADLPEALRAHMAVIRHRTFTNAHPEMGNVLDFHGGVKGPGRIGVEKLPSMIAQETATGLGTTLLTPMNLGSGSFTYQGLPVRKQKPDELREIFSDSGVSKGVTSTEFADLRDSALDAIYKDVRASGTHAQKRFLDAHARSRVDARKLQETLSEALAPVGDTDDPIEKQIVAIGALFQHQVTPVITLTLPFGGDNHQDSDLEREVTEQLQGIEGIRRLWQELETRGIQDRVTFAVLNVFGRELERNSFGGRGHHGDDHTMVMFGPNVKPGLFGERIQENGRLRAGPIGDVPIEEGLAAAGKTLARACGVAEEVVEERIVGGRAL